jgi:hypothetical protein
MTLRRWRWFVGIPVSAVALAIAMKIMWFPDSWQIASALADGECTVRRGSTQLEVARACGAPDAIGIQPKVLSDRASKEWISFCSAPCEIRRGRIVFYGCNGRVDAVGHVHRQYNDGCVRQYEP